MAYDEPVLRASGCVFCRSHADSAVHSRIPFVIGGCAAPQNLQPHDRSHRAVSYKCAERLLARHNN
jgi:hypothetical protein